MTKAKSGFTIVELLIVIVVIAILAAITIVAYNGIQQRAHNTTTVSSVGAYVKLIKLYMAGENDYPAITSSYCLQVGPGSSCTRSASLDANLAKYGTLPGGTAYTDISYSYSGRTVDGNTVPLLLLYTLEGIDQDCGVSNIVQQTGATTYVTDSTTPRNTNGNLSGNTRCYVSIPFAG